MKIFLDHHFLSPIYREYKLSWKQKLVEIFSCFTKIFEIWSKIKLGMTQTIPINTPQRASGFLTGPFSIWEIIFIFYEASDFIERENWQVRRILYWCLPWSVSQSLTHSVTLKVNVNVLLPNKRENVLVSSVLGGNTTARYSLLLILTVHFVINTCLAYNNPSLFWN